jgi:hypothetical protein
MSVFFRLLATPNPIQVSQKSLQLLSIAFAQIRNNTRVVRAVRWQQFSAGFYTIADGV